MYKYDGIGLGDWLFLIFVERRKNKVGMNNTDKQPDRAHFHTLVLILFLPFYY